MPKPTKHQNYRFLPNLLTQASHIFILALSSLYAYSILSQRTPTLKEIAIMALLLPLSLFVSIHIRYFKLRGGIFTVIYPFQLKKKQYRFQDINDFTYKESFQESITLKNIRFQLKDGDSFSISNYDIWGIKRFLAFMENQPKPSDFRLPLLSPCGNYRIDIQSSEMRMSHWVDTPKLVEIATKEIFLDLQETCWHLAQLEWIENECLSLHLMHYPNGNSVLELSLDLANKKVLKPIGWDWSRIKKDLNFYRKSL